VLFGSDVFLKAAFTVDPTASPKTIDYILTEGEDRDERSSASTPWRKTQSRTVWPLPAVLDPRVHSQGWSRRHHTVWKRKTK